MSVNLNWVLERSSVNMLSHTMYTLHTMDIPKSNSLTSDAARSPSARNALSMFFDRSIASLSLDALTAQPIFDAFRCFFLFKFFYINDSLLLFYFLSLFRTTKWNVFHWGCGFFIHVTPFHRNWSNVSLVRVVFVFNLVGNTHAHSLNYGTFDWDEKQN